jgi:hypothetical protein
MEKRRVTYSKSRSMVQRIPSRVGTPSRRRRSNSLISWNPIISNSF